MIKNTKCNQNCKICSKDFHTSTTKFLKNLKTHVNSQNLKYATGKVYHKQIKFDCLLCDKVFTKNTHLRTHKKKHPHCELRRKSFTQQAFYDKHLEDNHSG